MQTLGDARGNCLIVCPHPKYWPSIVEFGKYMHLKYVQIELTKHASKK